MSVRPRRSVLYMPGSNARALEKAKHLAADALILDLEDAVAPDAKEEARRLVGEALRDRSGYGHRELIVRVNGLDTPWGFDDLTAAATMGADAVLLPKMESADMVQRSVRIMDAADAPPELTIWCMMETARGMLRAEDIAGSSARLECFVMGTSDLSKELMCANTAQRLPMLTSLSLCILAARASALAIVDGVHLDLNDEDGFRESCVQGAELGFEGKTLIHPKQIEAANQAFAPTEAAVTQARKVIEAHRIAAAEGQGVVVVDGRLIENLHVVMAERTVAKADAIARMS